MHLETRLATHQVPFVHRSSPEFHRFPGSEGSDSSGFDHPHLDLCERIPPYPGSKNGSLDLCGRLNSKQGRTSRIHVLHASSSRRRVGPVERIHLRMEDVCAQLVCAYWGGSWVGSPIFPIDLACANFRRQGVPTFSSSNQSPHPSGTPPIYAPQVSIGAGAGGVLNPRSSVDERVTLCRSPEQSPTIYETGIVIQYSYTLDLSVLTCNIL